ncbi:MAG: rRNA maturation RNase YbeY [Rickettsiales bacterium]|nr:rRNA maturation RNase YbeY [Rickettsiales bacterium]
MIDKKSSKKISRRKLLSISKKSLNATLAELKLLEFFKGCEVSIFVCDNLEIKKINRKYRKKNKPTNVLSFPFLEFYNGKYLGNKKLFSALPKPQIIGEIIISLEKCFEESETQNIPFYNHLTHLFIHSILHILGFDHERNDSDAEIMENLEGKILKTLKIKKPL